MAQTRITSNRWRGWPSSASGIGLLGALLWLGSNLVFGADFEAAHRQWLQGDHAQTIAAAERALAEDPADQEWTCLLLEGLLTIGQYESASQVASNALARESIGLRLRWFARESFLYTGRSNEAAAQLEAITQTVSARPWAYRAPADLVAFGRVALRMGGDPKLVRDRIFEAARQSHPDLREAWIASGELALDKHDFALAARTFEDGLKRLPEDPDLLAGLARAYAPSDRKAMLDRIQAALAHNPRHIPSLLLWIDHRIDAEEYADADELLDQIYQINPRHPELWAYRAVLAHLRHQPEAERSARESALRPWPGNPEVDHLIGRKLSQKYRFTEGAAHQREALAREPGHLRARIQLAQDLLRLGQADEGWRLAREVHQADPYDVTAYNLVTLHDTMAGFASLTNGHFIVRMSQDEAALYGDRVLDLLDRARQRLTDRYELALDHPVTVEIFPESKDFAVRTFGMPENPGYLGVCFGRVITASSPAAHAGRPVNWEAMLWHEFTHVITLQLTSHRMPRWLSEGISVFEEGQANPAWAPALSPRDREMILGDDLLPVSRLSAAFLTPPSSEHLQFAYFQSALAVEFIVERFGRGCLRDILRDLGEGIGLEQAIEKRAAPMARIDRDFIAFARARARELAPGLDWQKPASAASPGRPATLSEAIRSHTGHPANYWELMAAARRAIEDRQWDEAQAALRVLIDLHPGQTGPGNAHELMAAVHRARGDAAGERRALARLAEIDGEAPEAYLRLMELAAADGDWKAVVLNARRFLAVNPLVAAPYRRLAEACEALEDWPGAAVAYRTWLRLDPPNPAAVRIPLARALHRIGDPEARRQLLAALEDAPRHREGLRLLLEMHGAAAGASKPPAPAQPSEALP